MPSGIPIHDAGVGGLVDVILGPNAVNVREEVFALVGGLEEAHGDGGKLRPGDVPVGLKGAVLVAVNDAGVGEGRDGVVVPVILAHVAVGVGLAPELVPALVGEEAEEDGGHLGPGDVPLGLHVAVGIAHDVGIVVLGVQLGLVAGVGVGVGIGVRLGIGVYGWPVVLLLCQHEGRIPTRVYRKGNAIRILLDGYLFQLRSFHISDFEARILSLPVQALEMP